MSCNLKKEQTCRFNMKSFGTCDMSRIVLDGKDRTQLNWTELAIPEILNVPEPKPDIEHIDRVYVEAEIKSLKLIETPYAYKTYERLATALEISTATAAINLAVVDITPITDAVAAILSIPLLPAIPQVSALQAALAAVITASDNLTAAITDALTGLGVPCISAALVTELLNTVSAAVKILEAALAALITAANALAAAVAAIPVVGPAVQAAVDVLAAAVDLVVAALLSSVEATTKPMEMVILKLKMAIVF